MAPGPHPLAGKSGEGPPIAPPNWKWRAGNRISDMYFYSPSGKQFRSRPELANYLQTLSNPPDANLFRWRVTAEVLKNDYVPRDDVVLPKPAKRKAEVPAGGGNKRTKTSTVRPVPRASDFAVQPTQVEPAALFAPCRGTNLPQMDRKISSPASVGYPYLNGRDRTKGKCVRISVPHSFKSILAGRSSFKWLYDSDTLEKFLEEARRLKNKSAAETNEIRSVLLERHLDTSNICKYPNSVIRVFVRLLRNEEAPASMGKIELAQLCVNWKCKKRHFWCLLELGRMSSPRKFTKVNDVKRGGGLRRRKGSVCQSAAVGSNCKYSDKCNAVNGRVTGCTNRFLNHLAGTPRLDFRLPDGSDSVAHHWTRPSGPTGQIQFQESPKLLQSGNFDNATTRPVDVEGSSSELALSSSLKRDDEDIHAPYGEIVSEAVGGMLHRKDLSGQEEETLPLVESTFAANDGNDRILFEGIKDRTQGMSEQFPSNVVCREPSWDTAGISKASDSLQLRVAQAISEEPVCRGDYRQVFPAGMDFIRQTEIMEVMPQNDTESILPSGSAPDLCGENIIVITGFKSCSSKGTGIVYHGDEAMQLKGGRLARDGDPFTNASEHPSTSCYGREPSEMHVSASIRVSDALDGITERKGNPESCLSSKDGDLIGGFPGIVKSEAFELALPGEDKRVCSKEPGCTLHALGVATNSQVPESRWNFVQESFHRGEPQRFGNLPTALDDGGSIIRGDFSKTLFSDGIKLRMVHDPQISTLLANVDSTAFTTKVPAPQLLPAAVRQEPLVSQDEDVLPTFHDMRHPAHVSKPLVAEGEWRKEENLSSGSRGENHLLTPKQAFAARDSFACWCPICESDISFCRGCMCSFCREILLPGEDWKVVNCICNHVCHMDCALAANAAGVVKELGLDGELSCPSCSRKVDLWLFFQKRFDLILSLSEVVNVNLKCVEELLFQATQLLKGTEKIKYKSIERLVIESYELLRKFPVLSLVQNLLRAVRDELHMHHFDPDAETLEGGRGASATPEEMDWLKNERLARESFDNAKKERLFMDQVVDKVHKAYEDALNRRKQARNAPKTTIALEPQLLKHNVNPLILEKLLISQQAEIDQELKKLWDMRKFEARDFTTIRALDARAAVWIESLKVQRAAAEAAQAKLQHLKTLSSQSLGR